MKRLGYIILMVVLLFTLYIPFTAAEESIPERPSNYVNDYAGILDSYDEQRINQLCSDLEKKTTAQIVLVTVQNTGNTDISTFTFDLFKKWKLGKKGKDNGVLIVRRVNPKGIRIEVGPGLQGILPDGKVGAILANDIKPHFDAGRIGDGLYAGISSMAGIIEKEGGFSPKPGRKSSFSSNLFLFVFLPILIIIIFAKIFTGPVCPRCRKKVITEEQIVRSATEYQEGRGIRYYTCRECGHSYKKEFDIPRIVSSHTVWIDSNDDDSHRGGGFFGGSGGGDWSDSSDFGGGGGGDCDGGGAERDW